MAHTQLSRRTLLTAAGLGVAGVTGLTLWQSAAATPNDTTPARAGDAARAGFWGHEVHSVNLTVDQAEFKAMLTTYVSSQTKEWITATVEIDGATYPSAQMRLKGNSSLRGITTSATVESLPWKVSLDKKVPGANHNGVSTLVIRSNVSTTSLNEAVALEMLQASGLASNGVTYLRLSANGSAPVLRLAVESLDEQWVPTQFTQPGVLYKAEAGGDYSYRGADAASYDDIFDIEAGDDGDVAGLVGFLDFINNSSDADFVSELPSRLDTNAFADYLAFQALIDNFDDIDGPGNNSYLWWAQPTNQMTVVAWDHNLAFGLRNGPGQGQGAPGQNTQGQNTQGQNTQGQNTPGQNTQGQDPQAQAPGAQGQPPAGGPPAGNRQGNGQPGAGNGQGGPGQAARNNVLVNRYNQLAGGTQATATAKEKLTAQLIDSGKATAILQSWVDLLTSKASDLVPAGTITAEADTINSYVI